MPTQGILSMIVAMALLMPVTLAGSAQLPQQHPSLPGQTRPEDEQTAKIEREMAKKRNQQRQADLKRDTDKLLKLATELKQYVDKTNENVLSVDVINKAEQIEKLAHSVREKMKAE